MIYLNNGATSWPKPPAVLKAVQACLSGMPASQFRGGSAIMKKDVEILCREKLGGLLGISETERIFFTSGATESMNTVLGGLDYGKSDSPILVTQTEHNSVLRPARNIGQLKTHPVHVVKCTINGTVSEKALEEAVCPDARVLIVNHCSNVTGCIQDMEMIRDFSRKHGLLLVVDVSQSAGCIPVEIDKWKADAAVFTGHKSLLGIQGTGGFYIRSGIKLKPLKYGGTGRNSAQLTYENGDYEYEVGTQNMPGITGLLAGLEFIEKTGLSTIIEKEKYLMDMLYEGLKELPQVQVYGDRNTCRGPVLSMNFQGLKASDAAYILESGYGITVRAGLHCSPLIHEAMGTENGGTVRVSISWFTEEEDIKAFLKAAREIAGSIAGSKEQKI